MERNVGANEKNTRIIIGLIIIAAGVYFNSWFGVIGIIPLTTAALGYCPLYSIIKRLSLRRNNHGKMEM
jgi:hypothetical protein